MLNLTRVGTCPICKKRVERSYTDIFFPYCGYTCKRVVQRKEEEKEKEKIVRQQKLIEYLENRYREKRERDAIRMEKELRIKEIQERIAQCECEYKKNQKKRKIFRRNVKNDGGQKNAQRIGIGRWSRLKLNLTD